MGHYFATSKAIRQPKVMATASQTDCAKKSIFSFEKIFEIPCILAGGFLSVFFVVKLRRYFLNKYSQSYFNCSAMKKFSSSGICSPTFFSVKLILLIGSSGDVSTTFLPVACKSSKNDLLRNSSSGILTLFSDKKISLIGSSGDVSTTFLLSACKSSKRN